MRGLLFLLRLALFSVIIDPSELRSSKGAQDAFRDTATRMKKIGATPRKIEKWGDVTDTEEPAQEVSTLVVVPSTSSADDQATYNVAVGVKVEPTVEVSSTPCKAIPPLGEFMAPGAPAAKKRPKSVQPAKVAGPAIEWVDLEDDVTSVLGTGVSIAKERVTGELPSSRHVTR